MNAPGRDRPDLPDGYGLDQAIEFLPWDQVAGWLTESPNYWLATTRPDGRPHVVPRWGVWHDNRFWYDGSPETVHSQNVEINPACALHLESGTDVAIVEGTSLRSEPISRTLGKALAEQFGRKYRPDYEPDPEQWSDEMAGGMRILTPERVLAWSDFPKDVTRFTF